MQVAADLKRMAEEQLGVPGGSLDRVDSEQARDPPCQEVSAAKASAPEPAMTGILPQRSVPTDRVLSSAWAQIAEVGENQLDEELGRPVGGPVARAPAPTVVVNTPIPGPDIGE